MEIKPVSAQLLVLVVNYGQINIEKQKTQKKVILASIIMMVIIIVIYMAGNINPHGVGRVAFVESGQLIKWKESIKNRRPVWSRIDVTYRTFVPWLIKSSRSRQQRS